MFPWSDTCLFKRLSKQRRLSQKEEEVLDLWSTGNVRNFKISLEDIRFCVSMTNVC